MSEARLCFALSMVANLRQRGRAVREQAPPLQFADVVSGGTKESSMLKIIAAERRGVCVATVALLLSARTRRRRRPYFRRRSSRRQAQPGAAAAGGATGRSGGADAEERDRDGAEEQQGHSNRETASEPGARTQRRSARRNFCRMCTPGRAQAIRTEFRRRREGVRRRSSA